MRVLCSYGLSMVWKHDGHGAWRRDERRDELDRCLQLAQQKVS